MGHPVTTNPLIIMLINMSIVFAVLIGLSIMIRLIHLVDPTKEKEEKPAEKAPTPAAQPAAAPAPTVDQNVNIAVIAAAVAACGCSPAQIKAVRPAEQPSWSRYARERGMR